MNSVIYSLAKLKRITGFPYPLDEIGLMINHFVWHKDHLIDRYFICFSFNKEKYNSSRVNRCPAFGIIPPGTVLNTTAEVRHDELFFSYSKEVSEKLAAVFEPLRQTRRNVRFLPNAEFTSNLSRIRELLESRMIIGNIDKLDSLALQMSLSAIADSAVPMQVEEPLCADMKIQEAALRLKHGEKLKTILRQCGFSRRAFYYEWNRNFSVSPKQFQQEAKLEKAQNLLLCTARPIAEIAQECGFSSLRYFHECFLKHYLCTPGEYRRRYDSPKI